MRSMRRQRGTSTWCSRQVLLSKQVWLLELACWALSLIPSLPIPVHEAVFLSFHRSPSLPPPPRPSLPSSLPTPYIDIVFVTLNISSLLEIKRAAFERNWLPALTSSSRPASLRSLPPFVPVQLETPPLLGRVHYRLASPIPHPSSSHHRCLSLSASKGVGGRSGNFCLSIRVVLSGEGGIIFAH